MITRLRSTFGTAAAIVLVLVLVAEPSHGQEPVRPYLREMNAPENPPAATPSEASPASRDDAYRPGPSEPASTFRSPKSGGVLGRPGSTALRSNVPADVEKGTLAPVMSGDGSGLPLDLWNGVDMAAVEKLLSEIAIPPRSAALHDLWRRLILSDASPARGVGSTFAAVRLEALYRSGLANEAANQNSKSPPDSDPVLVILAARNELANANRDKACDYAGKAALLKGDVPKRVKAEAVLLNGYCSAVAGDTSGAGLAAELAREEGQEPSVGLAALDAISINAKPHVKLENTLSLLDYRLLEIAGATLDAAALEKAEPALLVALTNDGASKPELRLQAAEAAARLNAIPPDALAAIYSALAGTQAGDSEAGKRAVLFKAMEAERAPIAKAQRIAALIEDARRAGLGFQAMKLVSRAFSQIKPDPALSAYIDTGAEIGLVAGNYGLVRSWVALSPRAASHWLALADIADPAAPERGQHLVELEALALNGRFKPEALHRLATVLEALDYLVPIPLWESANRSPQPTGGYLPETGVLPELQQASQKHEFGHTVLLVMKTLGPEGPEAANLIALGDSIRALKRAGLEADARRMALEALLGSWPRSTVN